MQTTYDENTNTTKYEFENMTLIKNNENGYYRLIDICKSCGKNGSTNDITSKNWYQKIIAESSKELHKEAQYETRCNPKGIFIHEYCILLKDLLYCNGENFKFRRFLCNPTTKW